MLDCNPIVGFCANGTEIMISHYLFWVSVAYVGYETEAHLKSGPGRWMDGNFDAGVATGIAYVMGWEIPEQHEKQDSFGNHIGVLEYPTGRDDNTFSIRRLAAMHARPALVLV